MGIKIGDRIKCVSIESPNYERISKFLTLDQDYLVTAIGEKRAYGIDYITVMTSMGAIPYHPTHFDIKLVRKEKLKKIKKNLK